MYDGIWVTDPIHIKELVLNFFKDTFQAHESNVVFPPIVHSSGLNSIDRECLEANVSFDEIKSAIWDCGCNKAPGPDVLSNWLSKVIDKIVSKEQSTFIKGRQILDGPLILSEVIHWFRQKKKKMLIFKVDFEKAFDSVSWKYLDF
ncbi:RNA-directed DNA polymerase, eukaryota, reverse transcriptase zinc-binding domain protein, partial [Tanacetum coccineum]